MKPVMTEPKQPESAEVDVALADLLADEEFEVWTGAYSVRMFLPAIIVGLPITAVLYVIARIAGGEDENNALRYSLEGALLFGWIVLLGFACFWVLGTEYMLTNKRLYCRRGFGHPGSSGIELVHFRDVRVQQSRLERWLRAGRIILTVANGLGAPCVLAGVPDPERVANIFRKHIRAAQAGR
jgi:Bacterial PH domain